MAVKQHLAAAGGPGAVWGSVDKVSSTVAYVLLSPRHRLGRTGQ